MIQWEKHNFCNTISGKEMSNTHGQSWLFFNYKVTIGIKL